LLHWRGLLGQAPLWLMIVLTVLAICLGQPEFRQLLVGRGPDRRLHRAVALQFGFLGLIIYLSGWGPLLAIVFPIITTMYLRSYGSAVWRPAVVWTLVCIGVGQAAIALGWVYCYFSPSLAQVSGLLGAQTGLLLIRALGLSAEQRESAEAEVRRREERFRALVQDSSDVVSVVDAVGRTLYVSPAIEHVTGLPPEKFIEVGYSRWLYPDDHDNGVRLFKEALADPGGEHRTEVRMRHARGDLRWMEVTLRNLLDNPAVAGIVATYRDITERRAIQERLIHDAHHDPLTGLANRAAFLHALEQNFIEGAPDRTPAVLFVDLDGFKQINDNYGHAYGDELIVAVAVMLRRGVLGSDVIGRLGGDEFGVVLTAVVSPGDAVTVARRILSEMDAPVLIGGQELYARASIGIAVAGPGVTSADELLQRADLAMYGAKRRQAHSFQLYDPYVSSAPAYLGGPRR
jgi:diguanylate cyclase (GGDEF)-like protein/PAS domain S-box-containing protein